MLTHQALPTISNISNENQSNVSTQQDYTYRMIKEVKNLKTKAFTLAEVLVTLGIIGVVAALTLPILMTK